MADDNSDRMQRIDVLLKQLDKVSQQAAEKRLFEGVLGSRPRLTIVPGPLGGLFQTLPS